MLNDIRLDGRQLALLHRCAEVAGAELIPDYAGGFSPANGPVCIGLRATSPGQLVHLAALVAIALDLPDPLLLAMAGRICEDYPGNDARRVYYWPGIVTGGSPDPRGARRELTARLATHRETCVRCRSRLDRAGRNRAHCPEADALTGRLQELAAAGL